jgi:hypothetical protein
MKKRQYIRDEDERRNESLKIIYQIKQNKIDSNYSGIRMLLEELTDYVTNGNEKNIEIPLPEMNKVINCFLPLERKKKCVVVLKHIR